MIHYYVYSSLPNPKINSNFHKWSSNLSEVVKEARKLSKEHRGVNFMVAGETRPSPGVTQSAGPTIDFLDGVGVQRGSLRRY